jgi:hypothetical protein
MRVTISLEQNDPGIFDAAPVALQAWHPRKKSSVLPLSLLRSCYKAVRNRFVKLADGQKHPTQRETTTGPR